MATAKKATPAAVRELGDGTIMIHAGSRHQQNEDVNKALVDLEDTMRTIRESVKNARKR